MGDASRWTAEQKMGVVVHKNPGVAGGLGFRQHGCKAINQGVPVLVIGENRLTLNAPDHHMMQ